MDLSALKAVLALTDAIETALKYLTAEITRESNTFEQRTLAAQTILNYSTSLARK